MDILKINNIVEKVEEKRWDIMLNRLRLLSLVLLWLSMLSNHYIRYILLGLFLLCAFMSFANEKLIKRKIVRSELEFLRLVASGHTLEVYINDILSNLIRIDDIRSISLKNNTMLKNKLTIKGSYDLEYVYRFARSSKVVINRLNEFTFD